MSNYIEDVIPLGTLTTKYPSVLERTGAKPCDDGSRGLMGVLSKTQTQAKAFQGTTGFADRLTYSKGNSMTTMDKTPIIHRGGIYYVSLDPVLGSEQGGTRPAAVLQCDVGNRASSTTVVAPITTQSKPPLPTHVLLSGITGLADGSILLLEQLRTIDRQRFGRFVGTLDETTLHLVDMALKIELDISSDRSWREAAKRISSEQYLTRRGAANGSEVSTVPSIKHSPINTRTLCPVCRNSYLDAGFRLRRLNEASSNKEICMSCNYRLGFDFEVIEP